METESKEGETTETSQAPLNGTNGTVAADEAPKASETVKPWIAAGFKSRSEWRASKGQKTGKSKPAKVKAAAKTAKKSSKKVKKPKLTAKPKGKKPKKPAKVKALAAKGKFKAKATERKYKPLLDEPSIKAKKVLKAFGGIGKVGELSVLGKKAFPSLSAAKGTSWVRNQMRWLFANKYVSHTAPGEYKRLK